MDIVDFLEKQVEQWNEDLFCGSCWVFAVPLTEDRLNVQQWEQEVGCCNKIMITDLRERDVVEYLPTGFISSKHKEITFEMYVLKFSQLGQNVYTEVNGHGKEEGLWELFIKDFWKCFDSDIFYSQCEILGYKFQVRNFFKRTIIDYQDSNYSGLKISITIRKDED